MTQVKKCFLSLIFFLSLALASYAENPVQEIFFELTRQCVRGISTMPVSDAMVDFSRPAAEFFVRPLWREYRFCPLSVIEYYYPEKIGVLDSTYSSTDLFGIVNQGEEDSHTDWVDSALLAIKMRANAKTKPEHFDVAEQMLSQMDNRDEGGIMEGDQSKDAAPTELSYTDSAGHLRRFSYGEEQFSMREKDGVRTMIDSAEGLVIRRFFDDHNLILKKESFKVGASARSLQLLTSREYAYHENEAIPYEMTEDITNGNKHNVTRYDERGLALQIESAHYVYPDKKSKKHKNDPPRLVKDKTDRWTYDDEKRITMEESITYLYSKTATGKEKIEQNVIKKTYNYKGLGKLPDVDFYENEELRMRTVYESENVYNETMYFDDGFTVLALYENSVKRLEIISVDGVELRRRSFEK